MGYIYKITNDINNKVYIGKTLKSIEARFHEHIKDSKRIKYENRPLYRAMCKYGVEHFQIEMIGKYPDDELSNMEIYWIAYYRGYEDGYNATKGGDGKPYLDREAMLKRLKEFPYPKEVAKEFNCCPDSVCDIGKENNIKMRNYNVDCVKKPVYCLDKKTLEVIQIFESTVATIKWCNQQGITTCTDSTHIADCAKGKRKSAYGYVWKYQSVSN